MSNYKIQKHREPFGGFPAESCYSVSEKVGDGGFAIVYEAMLTKKEAARAVKALEYADGNLPNEYPDDLAIFLERAVYGKLPLTQENLERMATQDV